MRQARTMCSLAHRCAPCVRTVIHSQHTVIADFAVVRAVRLINLTRLAVSFESMILIVCVFLSFDKDHPPNEHLHLRIGEVAGRVERELLDALVVVRTDVEQTVVPLLKQRHNSTRTAAAATRIRHGMVDGA